MIFNPEAGSPFNRALAQKTIDHSTFTRPYGNFSENSHP
jgi:hypothetical protein